MKITLTGEESLRIDAVAGQLTIEAESPDQSYTPFHMLGSAVGMCTFAVLQSWASNKSVPVDDLHIDVRWQFVAGEHRDSFGARELFRINAELARKQRIQLDQSGIRDRRRAKPLIEFLRQPRIAVVEVEVFRRLKRYVHCLGVGCRRKQHMGPQSSGYSVWAVKAKVLLLTFC